MTILVLVLNFTLEPGFFDKIKGLKKVKKCKM